MKVLVTGSSGLIGSEIVYFFDSRAEKVVGIDNNMRADFFGSSGDTSWVLSQQQERCQNFEHRGLDIRDRESLVGLFQEFGGFDLVVHAAAQPSHDLAASRPLDDFDVNAVGTLNVLEACRQVSPEAVFVFLSTNKVYGDAPNEVPLKELETRWEYELEEHWDGIDEDMRIDRSKHSVFGASKVAADIMVQEYGRYFGMRTTSLRCGCLTGPKHSGVELHGFLSYLVRTQLLGGTYRVFGYKGKQVRDNIHSYDVARAIECIQQSPGCGDVFNLGGGRDNSCSILEAFAEVERLSGKAMAYEYVETNREGDHICYITDTRRFEERYPSWQITRSLEQILQEIIEGWRERSEEAGDG